MNDFSPETIYGAYTLYMAENYPSLDPVSYVDILRFYEADTKIECIKAVRTGGRPSTIGYPDTVARYLEKHLRAAGRLQAAPVLGLAEAKDWVDALWEALAAND